MSPKDVADACVVIDMVDEMRSPRQSAQEDAWTERNRVVNEELRHG